MSLNVISCVNLVKQTILIAIYMRRICAFFSNVVFFLCGFSL